VDGSFVGGLLFFYYRGIAHAHLICTKPEDEARAWAGRGGPCSQRADHFDPEAGDACVLWCLAIRHAILGSACSTSTLSVETCGLRGWMSLKCHGLRTARATGGSWKRCRLRGRRSRGDYDTGVVARHSYDDGVWLGDIGAVRSPATARLLVAVPALPLAIEAIQSLLPMLGGGCQSRDVVDNLLGLGIGLALGVLLSVVRAGRTRS
jgi:hypothetical protein